MRSQEDADVLTQGSFFSKLYIKVFWSGTGVFTYRKRKSLKDADITCLDYSIDMIRQAEERMKDQNHISFIQGDVGALPIDTESCDIVLSMNGLLRRFRQRKS